jgi:hypothetical protein
LVPLLGEYFYSCPSGGARVISRPYEEFARLFSREGRRPVRDLAGWLPDEVSDHLTGITAEAASWLNASARTPTQVDRPRQELPAAAEGTGRVGVFGPPQPLDTPPRALPGTASEDVQRAGRRPVPMAVAAGATALATLIALAAWAGQRPDEPRSPGGSGRPSASRSPSSPSPSASATVQAPDGYKLVFAERPFTFAPPPMPEQWNIIDFDIPQATLFERGSLQGPGELTYGDDGITGSVFSVVGPRTTVCDQAEETAMVPHPLPAAELRNGRILKAGLSEYGLSSPVAYG